MLLGNTFINIKEKEFKGENGTIIILGGSYMYSGAPLFSAKAALRSGADLVYIFTDKDAVLALKSLNEAIVMPFEFMPNILEKATACVIGPGLGKVNITNLEIIKTIVNFLNCRNVPFIIDGDGIHLYKSCIFNNLGTVILTPNHKESINLVVDSNHICIYKGKIDTIKYKDIKTFVFNKSGLKRCGGQGDILSGILATAVSLNNKDIMDACISACEITREASYLSFLKKGYSLITSDIIDMLCDIFKNFILENKK